MIKNKLRQIKDICSKYSNSTVRNNHHNFAWGIHSKCRYGLTCPSLQQFDRECNQITREIEATLTSIAASNSKDYHAILDLCRGNFPAVYGQLEQIHYLARKEDTHD